VFSIHFRSSYLKPLFPFFTVIASFLIPLFLAPDGMAQAPVFARSELAGRSGALMIDDVGERARLSFIGAMWGDETNLYVSDDSAVRVVDRNTHRVTTLTRFASLGPYISTIGSDSIYGLWGDGRYLYGTDPGENSIRRIDLSSGQVEVFAASFNNSCSILCVPWGLWGRAGSLFVGNSASNVIQKVSLADGTASVLATPPGPFDPINCVGISGCFGYLHPSLKQIWGDGTYLYAIGYAQSFRKVNLSTGEVTIGPDLPFVPTSITGDQAYLYLAGGGQLIKIPLGADVASPATVISAGFVAVAMWTDGSSLYFSDRSRISALDLASGATSIMAGSPRSRTLRDGVGAEAQFAQPYGVWGVGTTLFVADHGNEVIRTVDTVTRRVTTLAGVPGKQGYADGPADAALFRYLRGIWADDNYAYVIDPPNIRRVRVDTGEVNTLTGGFPNGEGLWGEGSLLYVPDPISRIVKTVDVRTGDIQSFASFGPPKTPGTGVASTVAIWGNTDYLYVVDGSAVRRIVRSSRELSTVADVGRTLEAIWGDSNNVYVTGAYGGGSNNMWQISLRGGRVALLIDGTGTVPTGSALTLFEPTGLWGDGQSIYVTEQSNVVTRLTPTSLPAQASFTLGDRMGFSKQTANPDGAMTVGYASIDSSGNSSALGGAATFTFRQNGVVVSETTVPASRLIRSGRLYALTKQNVNTGVAFANAGAQAANISFYFTDSNGRDFGASSIDLAAGAQIARFLTEAPFNGSSFEGTFTFSSSVPVAAIALRGLTNERSEFLMTTLPITELPLASNPPQLLPHFADGGGWKTQVVLVNPTDQTLTGSLQFYSEGILNSPTGAAGPMARTVDGINASTFKYSIPARASQVLHTSGDGAVVIGSVRLMPDGNSPAPSSLVIFYFTTNGITVTASGVPASPVSKSFRLYAKDGMTGLAIANPAGTPITVYVELTSMNGSSTGNTGTLQIPANGHLSMFLHQISRYDLYGPVIVRVSTLAPTGIAMIGVRSRYNERQEFLITTTPALDESVAPAEPMVFPHFVTGGGYTTEFVLFNRSGGLSAGMLRYATQAGDPIPLLFQ